jgi:hypothetical protein
MAWLPMLLLLLVLVLVLMMMLPPRRRIVLSPWRRILGGRTTENAEECALGNLCVFERRDDDAELTTIQAHPLRKKHARHNKMQRLRLVHANRNGHANGEKNIIVSFGSRSLKRQ